MDSDVEFGVDLMVREKLIFELALAVEYARNKVVGASCVLAGWQFFCEVFVLEDKVIRLKTVGLVDYKLLLFLD